MSVNNFILFIAGSFNTVKTFNLRRPSSAKVLSANLVRSPGFGQGTIVWSEVCTSKY